MCVCFFGMDGRQKLQRNIAHRRINNQNTDMGELQKSRNHIDMLLFSIYHCECLCKTDKNGYLLVVATFFLSLPAFSNLIRNFSIFFFDIKHVFQVNIEIENLLLFSFLSATPRPARIKCCFCLSFDASASMQLYGQHI